MKDWLSGAGGVLLVVCGLLTVATIQTGGVRHIDSAGHTTEVLTWQGWQPAGAATPPPAVAPAAPQVYPTVPLEPAPQLLSPTSRPVPTVAFSEPPAAPAKPQRQPAQQVILRDSEAVPAEDSGGMSPWDVLGWMLVGLCAVLSLALAVYLAVLLWERILRRRRRIADQNTVVAGIASLGNRVAPPETAGEVASAGDQDHPLPGDAVDGRPVELRKYLAGEA